MQITWLRARLLYALYDFAASWDGAHGDHKWRLVGGVAGDCSSKVTPTTTLSFMSYPLFFLHSMAVNLNPRDRAA